MPVTTSQEEMALSVVPIATPTDCSPEKRDFFAMLPAELRLEIYRHVLISPEPLRIDSSRPVKAWQPQLSRTCKKLRSEVLPFFYKHNTFSFDRCTTWLGNEANRLSDFSEEDDHGARRRHLSVVTNWLRAIGPRNSADIRQLDIVSTLKLGLEVLQTDQELERLATAIVRGRVPLRAVRCKRLDVDGYSRKMVWSVDVRTMHAIRQKRKLSIQAVMGNASKA